MTYTYIVIEYQDGQPPRKIGYPLTLWSDAIEAVQFMQRKHPERHYTCWQVGAETRHTTT